MARPAVPVRRLAPITTTDFGARTCRRLAASAVRSRRATVSRKLSSVLPVSSEGSGIVTSATPSS
jgi:hypothetical protein